tara:strand:- start:834 stop:1928 length:1095 start_codon:yes stop_codon:yes gene_type:complete
MANSDDKDKTSNQLVKFALSLFVLCLIIFLYFLLGSGVLLITKLTQSNILPTDISKFPYVAKVPPANINYTTDVFITTDPLTKKTMSQKINITNKGGNDDNILLELVRGINSSGTISAGVNFLVTVFLGIYSKSFGVYKLLFGIVGKYMPESVVLLVGPILLLFLMSTNTMLILQFIFMWLSSLPLLFRRNTNSDESGKAIWEPVYMNWGLNIVEYGICFCTACIFIVLGFFMMFVMVPLSVFAPVISMFNYKVTINKEPAGLIYIAKKVFSYNRSIIGGICSVLIIISALMNVGIGAGFGAMVIFALFVSGTINSEIFKTVLPSDLTNLTSKMENSNEVGEITQKGGKAFVKLIKKIGNKMKK